MFRLRRSTLVMASAVALLAAVYTAPATANLGHYEHQTSDCFDTSTAWAPVSIVFWDHGGSDRSYNHLLYHEQQYQPGNNWDVATGDANSWFATAPTGYTDYCVDTRHQIATSTSILCPWCDRSHSRLSQDTGWYSSIGYTSEMNAHAEAQIGPFGSGCHAVYTGDQGFNNPRDETRTAMQYGPGPDHYDSVNSPIYWGNTKHMSQYNCTQRTDWEYAAGDGFVWFLHVGETLH
jgi:hypothetical protein